ncbi:MAG: hypothetical protein QM802_24995 [Agriterribacter sp.]
MPEKKLKSTIQAAMIGCFTTLIFFLPQSLKSQMQADTALLNLQKKNAVNIYYQSLQIQAGIYNGSEYVPYVNTLKEGHPYFDTTAILKGSVLYDGMQYNDIPMLYDIITDQLIIQHYNKVFLVQLIRSKVDSFNLLGHSFVHLGRDSTKDNVKEGYYDLVYNGKTKFYVRRTKDIQESIPDMTVERRVYAHKRFFIYKNNMYNEVYNQASVLALFKEKRGEIKQALRKQHIKFRKQREAAIALMAQQYDALNP